MARLIKFLLTTFVVGFFIFALTMKVLFDPNQYKQSIQSKITEKTGYVLDMPNPLALNVFPSLSISTTDFSAKNTAHTNTPFLKAEEVQVKFKFLPLLLGKMVIQDIQLEQFNLFLRVTSDGSNNWMAGHDKNLGKKASFEINRGRISAILNKVRLEAFTLKEGTFIWQDDFKNLHYVADIETFHSGNMLSDTPYDIRLEASVKNKKKKTASNMSFEAHILPNSEAQEHKVEHLRYTKSILEHPYFKTGTQLQVQGQGIYDHRQKAVSFPNFNVTGLGLEAEVPFTGRLQPEGLFVTGDFKLEPSTLNQVPQYLKKTPKTLKSLLNNDVTLATRWQLSPEWLTLNEFVANLGTSQSEGQITLALNPSKLSQYNLKITELQIQPKEKDGSGIAWFALASALPKSTGDVQVGSLLWDKTHLSNVKLIIETHLDELKVTKMTADSYQGTVGAELLIKKEPDNFQAKMAAQLRDSNLQPLLSGLSYPSPIDGKMSLELLLSSQSPNVEQLSQMARGPFSLSINEGTFKGADLNFVLREAIKDKKTKEGQYTKSSEARTPFTKLIANGVFENNQMNIQKLEIIGPGWVMLGNGLIDTKLKVLNFDTKLNLLKEDGTYSEYQNIPFNLSGAIEQPSYKIDFVQYLKKRARQRINQSIDKQNRNPVSDRAIGH